MTRDARTKQKTTRFTESEVKLLLRASRKIQLKPSEFIREATLEKIERVV